MNTTDYTPESICLSLGLPGFEDDHSLRNTDVALRLLLQPSFHPEVCVTFFKTHEREVLAVSAARNMIWHLPRPTPVPTDSEECEVATGCLQTLLLQFARSTTGLLVPGIMIDGMPVDAIALQRGSPVRRVKHNVSARSPYAEFVAQALNLAWGSLANPFCKNAIASAAKYARLDLPRTEEPERKPVFRILVMGSGEDRHELLEALRRCDDA
jgi:hypothetical protein